ncbi:MAG: ChuX/HutX family heme-like substrate-binding protein [Pseudomonadota bacterium]
MDELGLTKPSKIRATFEDNPKLRERDIAHKAGVSESQLLASLTGKGAAGVRTTRIQAQPDDIIAAAMELGEVMALTRNESCVHEKVGMYENYHSGAHASMVLTEDIDLRMFPSHWRSAFAVEKEMENGTRKSLQVFDAAGDSVHKIFLRDASNHDAWQNIVGRLSLDDQSDHLDVSERKPAEAPKYDLSKLDILRKEWKRLTDTHQFLRLTSKLKMNRLGAYRIADAPFVRELSTGAVDQVLNQLTQCDTEVMIFVGNKGCIQIHNGRIGDLRPMGPWQNVMDPGFNLHLRLDHIKEVWAVEKPTQRGPAVSVEAFDAEGGLILQMFGVGKEGHDSRPAWKALVDTLPDTTHSHAVVAEAL